MDNRKRRFIGIGLAGLAVIAVVFYFVLSHTHALETLRVSGNIEVTDAEVSFKIPGRVSERLVDEGMLVTTGQTVARLESADLAEQVAVRTAEWQAAQAFLEQMLAGSRPEEIQQARDAAEQSGARLEELLAGSRTQEIATAQASLSQARADAVRAHSDFDRYARLFKKENVSAQQYDAAKAAMEMAEARQKQAEQQLQLVQEGPRHEQIEQARAALAQARAHYALVKKGPRREEIEQARARADEAHQALAIAQTQLGYATLTSPFAGVVLSKNVESGEFVSPGTPVITIADLKNVWLRAYINESDLGRVKLGQRVFLTTDTYPGKKYEGKISFISSQAEFTPKNVQTEKERVKLVYRIKVDVENPNMELKPGMPADADIELRPNARS
ncbi:MAG: efflux RND transporter periplasmic adaptor subunit [Acidobacteriia bacterium]|nr:efflux RND transporter periplasmic adaptor subunit [Terriglobia bacterium]